MTTMTDEEMRVRIAEICGWEEMRTERIVWSDEGGGGEYDALCGQAKDRRVRDELPNYLHDLNAMHEAERSALVEYRDGKKWRDRRNEYCDALWFVCAPIRSGEESRWGFPDFATARQRAEAFLRVFGEGK